MTTWRWFDPAVDTEETAKAKRKRLARSYHPDIAKDDGIAMKEINTELEAFLVYLNTPIPIPVQVHGVTNPHSYWAAVVGSAKVNVNGGAMPQTGRPAPPRPQPNYTSAPPPPSPFPGGSTTYSPPPVNYAPPPPPSPAPAPRTRRAGVRVARGTNIAALEQEDYEKALLEPVNKNGVREHNRVGIIWQDYDRWGALVVVNDIRVGTYRLQIRVAGVVQEEFPLTRAWHAERQAAIAHAKANYL